MKLKQEVIAIDSSVLEENRRYMRRLQEVIASKSIETPFLVEEYCVIVTVRRGYSYVIEMKESDLKAKIHIAIETLIKHRVE